MLRYKLGGLTYRLLFFCKHGFDLIYKIGPKKGKKNVRKIEVSTDTLETVGRYIY